MDIRNGLVSKIEAALAPWSTDRNGKKPMKPDHPDSFLENEEANVNISLTAVVLSVELLEEKVIPMGPCENGGQPDEIPVVVGHADDEDEEDEDEEDLDEDLDEDDEEDEEELDDEWEEVPDDDEDEEDDDEEDE